MHNIAFTDQATKYACTLEWLQNWLQAVLSLLHTSWYIEPPQCYGEVQSTTAVTRHSCVGQPFCNHQPGMYASTL